ncbi:hypothetical protein AAFC00_004924 [Neodothiora populina]|uniref:F-box domain-containing protein n=1 Tax=Neodothiora populina TaxID=2781224 RepID=A0ABR3P3X8_9PEZI
MLADLPTELLNHIIENSSASSISNLSQSSRALHGFVETEGWRTFNQTNFPSYNYPPYWRSAAHTLTTLSRNWQRRAFIAQYLQPGGDISAVSTGLPIKKWKRPGGQTMGFQSTVDSYQQHIGDKWHHRREVVAWSAGAELVVRIRLRTTATEKAFRDASPQDRQEKYDSCGTRIRWWSYRPFSAVEGRDDITSIKLVKPDTSKCLDADVSDLDDEVVIGTANGDLQLLRIPAEEDGPVKTYFVTNGVPVRSTSLCPAAGLDGDNGSLLAANLSDTKLALYKMEKDMFKIAPICEVDVMPQERKGARIWSTRFLNPRLLAVGLGPSVEPISIFTIRPEGIVAEPARKLNLNEDTESIESARASAVYPIEPLVDDNGDSGETNVFLSGGYDGVVRLHDLRSPSAYERAYRDPTDDAAVYSLLSRGRDKFVAGSSRHCLLKVFDLRVSGSSPYDYANLGGDSQKSSRASDWNIFINPREHYANSSWRGPDSWMRRSAEGSVYNLSSPSSTSPFVYAGVENAVVEFNFSAVHDRHPDPIFSPLEDTLKSRRVKDRKQTLFKNKRDVLNLAMYTQGNDGSIGAMKLRFQRSVDDPAAQRQSLAGLDERWHEVPPAT